MSNNLRHGDARVGQVARLHKIWRGMLKRCNPDLATPNPKYAGRGIRVCPEWRRYEAFKAWAVASGYADDLTIERENNDGHYTPANCRWVAASEQAKNRRTSYWVTHEGRTMVLADWAREAGIKSGTLRRRLVTGWPVGDALSCAPLAKPGRPRVSSRELPL